MCQVEFIYLLFVTPTPPFPVVLVLACVGVHYPPPLPFETRQTHRKKKGNEQTSSDLTVPPLTLNEWEVKQSKINQGESRLFLAPVGAGSLKANCSAALVTGPGRELLLAPFIRSP